ncbi:penicillin-binding protein 1C [Cochleicola gelatinilyticus]|uniref:peptidoglycan glycosyltransferase n=1 Tax=Cochleicola gelatinilyticus TaxID=1763537 RepID=A0A167J4H8_9FLAO|nr:penicillin-binding protein 1C [Cochleicola gelatinilyticus]OAB80330.1 penicillin-binding protein 1C [Cochleicola gelatinilyticus]
MKTRKHIQTHVTKHKLKYSMVLILLLGWSFCLPSQLFNAPTSTVAESKEGFMLGARIADDEQWRFPEMDHVPQRFKQAILYFEDEHFYSHLGFNPVSISKAFWQNLTTDSRRGGSTLTQQVIRLSRNNKRRSYWEKAIEIVQATRLEARYSKEKIIALYASHAPFGGNVVGLETASWRYFGIPASSLSWGQSAALAVLPNAPSLIFPGKNELLLKQKRDRLLLKLFHRGIIDKTTYELALEEPLPGKPLQLPEIAPHLTERIRTTHRGKRIQTTIDYSLQKKLNRITAEHHYVLKQNKINNLAVLVLDVDTREVLGYVGNALTTLDHNNYVDIISKPRSTGSTLKPFLYASLLHSGELLPNELIADIPTVVNGYSPENFDKQFHGAVPASTALSRSLNVPAVRSLQSHGLERFYNKLKTMQLKGISHPADYYGLTLILGGAESSLWDLTKAYAGMSSTLTYFNRSSSEYRTNEFMDPIYVKDQKVDFGTIQSKPSLFNAGAIYHTLNALQEVNRPQESENWSFFNNSQPIAWKTGTSYGFKDAWAVGVTSKYAIGVWVGNADGEGRPGLTGIQAAAPLLFDVLDVLPISDWFATPFDELIETEVCSKSGNLAGIFCDNPTTEWIPKEGLKTKACIYHHQVFLNKTETAQVNSSCYELSEMKQKSWFTLPPIQEYYYAPLHPEYKPLPSFASNCLQEGERTMEFIFPKRNETILLAKDFNEHVNEVIFKLAHRSADATVFWYLDSQFIGATKTFHELAVTPKPGTYVLTATDQEGNEIKLQIEISSASM